MNYVLFASYGNDSVALIQWAHEQGLTGLHVAYSDTGWAAPWWADRLDAGEAWAQSLGFATHRIGSEGMHGLVRRKKAWPRGGGGRFQFCTEALKERPAVEWMATQDPNREATCMVGVRREESDNRANWPEWTASSEKHDGRELWAPLVRHTEAMRNELVARTPMPLLTTRSKECWPCANANKGELKHMDGPTIAKVQLIEMEAGINSKGNARVFFAPARHGGAVGIAAVVEDAKHNTDDLFSSAGCDGGWCGS